MSVPTSFSDAQARYEAQQHFDITGNIQTLRTALTELYNAKNASPLNTVRVTSAQQSVNVPFQKVANYFNEMSLINDFLQVYLNKQSKDIAEDTSLSEERYENKVHPEESVLARESTLGLIPELRMRSLPYLLAISVFMASLTIFLIFQMFGFSGQVNLPSSITGFLSSPASPIPFYSNPLFLGGVIILLLVSLVIFAVLYFKSKNANN